MKLEKEFEGVLELDGDDGYCFGVHCCFKENKKAYPSVPDNLLGKEREKFYREIHSPAFDKEAARCTSVIDYLDKIAEEYEDKKVRIKISIEVME